MAEHKDIQEPNIHEPKGAATAVDGHAMFGDGLGGTSFRQITRADVSDLGLNIVDNYVFYDYTDQLLDAAGDARQVTFGAADTSPAGTVSVDANGTITFNTAGVYFIHLFGNIVRTVSVGDCLLMFRASFNSGDSASSISLSMDSAAAANAAPLSQDLFITANAGDTIEVFLGYEEDPGGSSGLSQHIPSNLDPLVWPVTPAASVEITAWGL